MGYFVGIYLSQRETGSERFTEEANDVGTTTDSTHIEHANDGEP